MTKVLIGNLENHDSNIWRGTYLSYQQGSFMPGDKVFVRRDPASESLGPNHALIPLYNVAFSNDGLFTKEHYERNKDTF